MARLLPETIHDERRARAEADFLRRLREELGDEWTVIHSLNLGAAERAGEFEADFVLLHPRGRITLELKGGTIICQDGVWWSINDRGRWRITPPFHQARRNSHEVSQHLLRVLGPDDVAADCPFAHAVVFPGCDFTANTIEAPRGRIFDRRVLAAPLSEVLAPVLDEALTQWRARQPGRPDPQLLGEADLRRARDLLRPDLRLVPSLSAVEFDAQLARLSAEQLAAFRMMEDNSQLCVRGPAGTGKTLMALEACRREARAHPQARIGLVCYNRLLGRHLAEAVEHESLINVKAGSLFRLMDLMLGLESVPAGSPHAVYAQRAADAAQAIAHLADEDKLDMLVVDEGQDFRLSPDHLRVLNGLLRGGLTQGRWRWFEDPAQALVYAATPPPTHATAEAALQALDAAPSAKLSRNWRNAEPIARAFARVSGHGSGETGGFEGPGVSLALAPAGRELDALDALLQKIVLTRHRPEEVVILSTRGAGRESFHGVSRLAGLPVSDWEGGPALPGHLRVSTVAKAKGLEAHAVVLVDLDRLTVERERRAAYVGMSRAKYALYLLAGPEAHDTATQAMTTAP